MAKAICVKSICMVLPVTACHALPAFSHVFHCSPVIGAGLSDLVSIYPSSAGGLKWPPRAGLPRLRMQGMQIWLQLDFLDEKRSGFKSQFVVGSRHQWIQD